jgi:formate hydrogenlyase subunit 3/multisubunit Na+/H+ antiporter MnhD subunit
MAAPLLFVGLPALLAVAVYWLADRPPRRVRPERLNLWLAVAAAAGAACLTLLAIWLPLDERVLWGRLMISSSYSLLGRTLSFDAADRLSLALMFGQGALLFLGAAIAPSGRYYLPAGLAVLGVLAAAMFVRPFIFAPLFLELAAAAAVLMLAGESPRQTRGAWRYLVFMTLALPFILISGWLLEGNAGTAPGPQALNVALTLGIGFAILLAAVPFQSWVPMVAQDAPPLAAAFVLVVMQQAVVFLLLTFLGAYPALGQNPTVYRAFTVLGGGMVLVGGLFAVGQRNLGRTLGYAVLVDIGAVLLGVGLQTPAGAAAALTALTLRGIALCLWGIGDAQLRQAGGGDDFDSLRGLGRRHPFAAAAAIFGLLSLVGFPLTAGFAGRWALLRLLAEIHPTGAILLWLAMASIALVCIRALAALLAASPDEPVAPRAETPAAMLVYGLGVLVVLALGAFPQWLLPVVANAAAVYSHPLP